MQDVQRLISLYHRSYQVFLGLTIFFLLLTIFLFFKFKIPSLFLARSGRAMKKTVKEIEANNARTGRLRRTSDVNMEGVRKGVSITYEEKKKGTGPLAGMSRKLAAGSRQSGEMTTDVLRQEEKTYPIRFQIEKNVMLIHSDEIL